MRPLGPGPLVRVPKPLAQLEEETAFDLNMLPDLRWGKNP